MVTLTVLSFFVFVLVPRLGEGHSRCQKVLQAQYDFIIVGGGSTGSVLASRLSENKDINVLLLEAGSMDTDIFESHVIDTPGLATSLIGSDIDWKHQTIPQQHCCSGLIGNRVMISEGKVLGGSSAIDDLTYMRGSPHVFDLWEEMGSTGWNYSTVLPYFVKAEDYISNAITNSSYRGKCGPVIVEEQKTNARQTVLLSGIKELGWPVIVCNEEEEIGICKAQTTIKNGERVSTSKAYLTTAMNRDNLDILTDALVHKIHFDDSNKATNVSFTYKGDEYSLSVNRDVIVSAGAIGSPKLLLLSGIGPMKHLQNLNIPVVSDLPVGENLQDGYTVPIRIYMNVPSLRPDKAMENVQRWRDYVYLRQGDLAASHVEAHMQLRTLPSKITKYPDLHVAFSNMLPDYDQALLKKLNIHDYIITDWYDEGLSKDGMLAHLSVQHPNSRGYIQLNSTQPTDPPLINPNYLMSPDDVEDILKGIRFLQAFMDTAPMQNVLAVMDQEFEGCNYLEFDSDDYWRCYIQNLGYSSNNPAGSVRMGRPDDVTAVLDPSLRVKNVKGLRVADSSIMPETTGFMRATEIMIGEKVADMLLKEVELQKSNDDNNERNSALISASQADTSTVVVSTPTAVDPSPSTARPPTTPMPPRPQTDAPKQSQIATKKSKPKPDISVKPEVATEPNNQDIMSILEQLLINEVSKTSGTPVQSLESALTTTEKMISQSEPTNANPSSSHPVKNNSPQTQASVNNVQTRQTKESTTVSNSNFPAERPIGIHQSAGNAGLPSSQRNVGQDVSGTGLPSAVTEMTNSKSKLPGINPGRISTISSVNASRSVIKTGLPVSQGPQLDNPANNSKTSPTKSSPIARGTPSTIPQIINAFINNHGSPVPANPFNLHKLPNGMSTHANLGPINNLLRGQKNNPAQFQNNQQGPAQTPISMIPQGPSSSTMASVQNNIQPVNLPATTNQGTANSPSQNSLPFPSSTVQNKAPNTGSFSSNIPQASPMTLSNVGGQFGSAPQGTPLPNTLGNQQPLTGPSAINSQIQPAQSNQRNQLNSVLPATNGQFNQNIPTQNNQQNPPTNRGLPVANNRFNQNPNPGPNHLQNLNTGQSGINAPRSQNGNRATSNSFPTAHSPNNRNTGVQNNLNGQTFSQSMSSESSFFIPDFGANTQGFGSFSSEMSSNLLINDPASPTGSGNNAGFTGNQNNLGNSGSRINNKRLQWMFPSV